MTIKKVEFASGSDLFLISNTALGCRSLLDVWGDLSKAGKLPDYVSGLSEKLEVIYNYSELKEPLRSQNRFIVAENCFTVLPPDPKDSEIELALSITELSSKAIWSYRKKYNLLSSPNNRVIPTVFYRTTEEAARVLRSPRYAGVISITYPPLWNTFNLEAAQYIIDRFGEEMGKKIIAFSYIHENGHQVIERHRFAHASKKGINRSELVPRFYATYFANNLLAEMAATELTFETGEELKQNGIFIFPDLILANQEKGGVNNIKKAIEEGNLDLLVEGGSQDRWGEDNKYLQPFVVRQSEAWAYAQVLNIGRRYQQTHPDFSWTNFLAKACEEDPLLQERIRLPLDMV